MKKAISVSFEQNKRENLELLFLQKKFYSRSKSIYYIITFLDLVLAFLGIISSESLSTISIVVVPYFIFRFLMLKCNRFIKNKAVILQEMFDCNVLLIEWNNLNSQKHSQDKIIKWIQKFKRQFDKELSDTKNRQYNLHNWYVIEDKIPKKKEAIYCQLQNIVYSKNLKNSFFWALLIVSTIIFLVIFFLLRKSSIELICMKSLPMFPLFLSLLNALLSIHKHMRTYKVIQDNIEKNVLHNTTGNIISNRSLQDKIYEFRKNSFSIPDFFYKNQRIKNEEILKKYVKFI